MVIACSEQGADQGEAGGKGRVLKMGARGWTPGFRRVCTYGAGNGI